MKTTQKRRRKGMTRTHDARTMRCPYCGSQVHLRSADGIYKDNSRNTQLYVCAKYPACDAYVRTHPGTTIPMGTLADAKLRTLRRQTHQHFDRLHESGLMTKSEAYAWLAYMLQAPLSQAHIGYQSEYYCKLIISESEKMLAAWSWKLPKKSRYTPASGGVCYAAQ